MIQVLKLSQGIQTVLNDKKKTHETVASTTPVWITLQIYIELDTVLCLIPDQMVISNRHALKEPVETSYNLYLKTWQQTHTTGRNNANITIPQGTPQVP